MIIGHGGNKQELAQKLGCPVQEIIDMSSNLNPLGPPPEISNMIENNLGTLLSLPEPDALTMRKGFARFHAIDPDQVMAGNGTTWFIYAVPMALNSKKVLICGPTYSDYKDACAMHGIEYTHALARSEQGFQPDMDEISDLAGQADLVFFCNPNNPTGALVSRDRIEFLLKRHPGTCFVIDESYLPFADLADEISLVSRTRYSNLLVLSSMSKIFRIPGLRTGFLSGDRALIEKLFRYYQPWSVNSLAQSVISRVFDQPEFILSFYEATREFTFREKQIFTDAVKECPGLKIYPGSTYFILAELQGFTAPEFCARVGQDKILIRDCTNFYGLTRQFVRFSLKTREINTKLAVSIKKVIQNG
ncbi:pyridoxal phosphate-dependent aminotransferase [Desulfospira joergensenii]|uniref:pyridoxal phosphate-dependent aminotransferase n=1 Tax=Desulfospira joergensenii TaxID=53329 RepID=UPI0003B37DFB|nr:threonine-phosphate decarboxylase [Desulfospira joergensenii]